MTPPDARAAGKREQTKLKNREFILDAARRVFAELGYGATTVRDIIRATPLASGTFYNYFRSKEEVFQAIRDETAVRIRPRLREGRMQASTLEAFISATFKTFFEYIASEWAKPGARAQEGNLRIRVDTPEILAGFHELREDIVTAMERGLFPPVDAGLLMASMVGVAFEVAEEMTKQSPPDPESAARFATALFLGGIRALPAGAAAHEAAAPTLP